MEYVNKSGVKGVHLLMPMGGAGSRFFKDGFTMPKPLIIINDKPFFYWAVKSVTYSIKPIDITFVVLQQHIDEFDIKTEILRYFPDANIVIIPEILPGPVFTARAGVGLYTDRHPILINDCDHMFVCSKLATDIARDSRILDGALLTFESNEPQFSYIKYDVDGNVAGTVEKQVVSNHAICGAYYFRNRSVFEMVMDEYILKCPYKECFISGMYNIMCEKGMTVKDYLLDEHVEFGTPKEYQRATNSVLFDRIEKGK